MIFENLIMEFFIVLVLKKSNIVSKTVLYTVVLKHTSLLEEKKNTDLNRTSFMSAAIRGMCGITWRIRYGRCVVNTPK